MKKTRKWESFPVDVERVAREETYQLQLRDWEHLASVFPIGDSAPQSELQRRANISKGRAWQTLQRAMELGMVRVDYGGKKLRAMYTRVK